MRFRTTLISLASMVLVSFLLFRFYERELSEMWMNLAIHPEIQEVLEQAALDQRTLARFNQTEEDLFRARFDRIQNIRNNLKILAHNRDELQSHFKYALWLLFGMILVLAMGIHLFAQKRIQSRIQALQEPLTDLAYGKVDITVADGRKDAIGRIGAMIERTSRLMAKQRDQLRYLDHLSNWQEASRRNAHEIRTPLTAARMEVERLLELEAETGPELGRRLKRTAHSIIEELDRLKRFTQEFTAFAKIRKPKLEVVDLTGFVADFLELFHGGWENLAMESNLESSPHWVGMDREMVRQVIVNLCNNSALAMGEGRGSVFFHIEVLDESVVLLLADNGPGVDQAIRDRIFEPYTTTRKIGDGMGLGLAISRKIMLDHGGDLELFRTSPDGTVFRLLFPSAGQEEQEKEEKGAVP